MRARITWVGHATFLVEAGSGTRLLLDCFVESCPTTPAALHGDGLGALDAIALTHGHADHIADVAAHHARTGATVCGMVELVDWLGTSGAVPDDAARIGFNKGGSITIADATITLVHAQHSSSTPDGAYAGEACGLVVRLADGYTIYHAGDTNAFGDMSLIAELYQPDIAILPIGGHFTMDPREAATAVRLLGVEHVIGGHWGTFPPLTGRPSELALHLEGTAQVHELEPGDSYEAHAAARV